MKKVYTKQTSLGYFSTDKPMPVKGFRLFCWILGGIALPAAAFFIYLGIKTDMTLIFTGAFWGCCAIFLILFPILQGRAWKKFYEEMRIKDEAEPDANETVAEA